MAASPKQAGIRKDLRKYTEKWGNMGGFYNTPFFLPAFSAFKHYQCLFPKECPGSF